MCWRKRISVAPDRIVKIRLELPRELSAVGGIREDHVVPVALGDVLGVALERVAEIQFRTLAPVQEHVHDAEQEGQRLPFDAEEAVAVQRVQVGAAQRAGRAPDMLRCLRKEACRPETGIVDAFAERGPDYFDHGPDDVSLRVELACVPGRVGRHPLQQIFVQLGQDDDVGLVREMQPVDLLHHTGEVGAALRVVADRREDPAEPFGDRIGCERPGIAGLAESAQMLPEPAVDEFEHLVRPVGAAGPGCPTEPAVQAAPVRVVVERGLLLAAIFGLIERLQEEQPGELLDVVPRVHAIVVEFVAGILHRLLHLLTPVTDHFRRCRRHASRLTQPSGRRDAPSPLRGPPSKPRRLRTAPAAS